MDAERSSSIGASIGASAWSPVQRALFRFAFAYLVLYNLPFPLDAIPWAGPIITRPYAALWERIVPWLGKRLFHLDIDAAPNGSGDTTFHYVQILFYLVLALAAAAVWTLLDRKRPGYSRLYAGLRVYVRFALATAMLGYGASKVIPSQFGKPFLSQLLTPFGEASPMGILWTFMGVSTAYTVFAGAAEMLAGVLLAIRRTALLGALVATGVLTNVVLLNFSYDVPVKQYSSHLLAMAVFLMLPDLRRLLDLLVLNRTVEPAEIRPLLGRPRWRRAALLAQVVFVSGVSAYQLYESYEGSRQFGNLAPKPPLYGIWDVDELETDGAARPPLLTDASRWRRVVFDYPGVAVVQLMDGTRHYRVVSLEKSSLTLAEYGQEEKPLASLAYQETQPGTLALEGVLDGHKARLKLRREDGSSYRLLNRGFHWINETPFNR